MSAMKKLFQIMADKKASDIFLSELGVGAPDHMLDVGSGTHAVQTARVLEKVEPVRLEELILDAWRMRAPAELTDRLI